MRQPARCAGDASGGRICKFPKNLPQGVARSRQPSGEGQGLRPGAGKTFAAAPFEPALAKPLQGLRMMRCSRAWMRGGKLFGCLPGVNAKSGLDNQRPGIHLLIHKMHAHAANLDPRPRCRQYHCRSGKSSAKGPGECSTQAPLNNSRKALLKSAYSQPGPGPACRMPGKS